MNGSPGRARSRFPASVFGHGTEPDPRFSLANERTFLSWITTGLALISVGVGLEALATAIPPIFRTSAAVLLILAGTLCPTLAWRTWMRTESALRAGRPLPPTGMAPLLVISLTLAGLLLLIGSAIAAVAR